MNPFRSLALGIALSLTGCSVIQSNVVDSQMEQLCASRPDAHVYERVALPRDAYNQYGNLRYEAIDGKSVVNKRYQYNQTSEILKEGSLGLTLTKNTRRFIDLQTGKPVSVATTYCKAGGSLIGAPTGGCCPFALGKDLEKATFQTEQ